MPEFFIAYLGPNPLPVGRPLEEVGGKLDAGGRLNAGGNANDPCDAPDCIGGNWPEGTEAGKIGAEEFGFCTDGNAFGKEATRCGSVSAFTESGSILSKLTT